MIHPTARAELERVCAEIDTGLRKVCCFCGADLPGSIPHARRVSHGACAPLCDEAKKLGWEMPGQPMEAA